MSIALFAASLLIPGISWAQGDADNAADAQATANQQDSNQQDPPARVGRLGFFEGDVSQYAADADDWAAAELNFPVSGNTAFATGANGRAEFELGSAVVRIGNGTELDIVALDEENTDLRLPQGIAQLRLPPSAGDMPIDNVVTTPRGDVTLAAPGRYVVSAGTADQPTMVTVFEGHAQVANASGATFDIAAGQAGVLSGDGNQPIFATQAARPDALDTWARQREAQYVAAAPLPPQVSPAMTGVSVLAAYGGWKTEPQYGPVWYPRGVSANWAPYREGHWSYVRPWGWTWIDNAPWGFAPFHYGRWVRVGNNWAWAPGTVAPTRLGVVIARPIYAPALVVFASTGGGAAARGPGVAWYPLGWNEPYIPAYHVSRRYIERVNVRVVEPTRIVQVTNIYNKIYVREGNRNAFDPYAQLHVGVYRDHAIAVPRTAFGSTRPVTQMVFKPTVAQLKPAVRPVSVTVPKVQPRPALNKAEPPKAKILPPTKLAPIPAKLIAPKKAPVTPAQPVAATVHPAGSPQTAAPAVSGKQEGKPEAKPGAKQPPTAHPEAKPEVKQPPVAHPEAKPEVKQPPTARPEARPTRPRRPEPVPSITKPKPGASNPAVKPAPPPTPSTVKSAIKPIPAPAPKAEPRAVKPEAKPVPVPHAGPGTTRADHQPTPTAKPEARPVQPKPEARPVPPAPKTRVPPPVMHPEVKPAPSREMKPAPHPAANPTPRPEVKPPVTRPEVRPVPPRPQAPAPTGTAQKRDERKPNSDKDR
ncbi:MAG TPA: DUF6600 domain-containing protein [Stellaceae bacterium]